MHSNFNYNSLKSTFFHLLQDLKISWEIRTDCIFQYGRIFLADYQAATDPAISYIFICLVEGLSD